MRGIIGTIGLVLSLMSSQSLAAHLVDGFEDDQQAWTVRDWGDGAKLQISQEQASEGKSGLEVSLDPSQKKAVDKGLFLRRGFRGRPHDVKFIEFDLYNSLSHPIQISLGVESDNYYESSKLKLASGWNRSVRFELTGSKFKTAASNWQYNAALLPEASIGNIMFIVYTGESKEGSIWLDNIRTKVWNSASGAPAQKPQINSAPRDIKVVLSPENVSRGEKVEVALTFDAEYWNPFDPEEIRLDGIFTDPTGRRLTVPGFLASGDVSLKSSVQKPLWKLRMTPDVAGTWTYQVKVVNPKGESLSESRSFEVEPKAFKGFVRVDKKDPHYFSFDSGEFYYPFGQNVAWESDDNYKKIFKAMHDSGQNWSRVWMTNWSFGLEWKEIGFFRGLGNYNLANADRLDRLLDLARENGIYLQLVFDFHGALSSKTNPEWMNNPYNKVNGGILSSPEEFWSSLEAKELYKRRLRYTVARWGYDPHVMAWEFFNEINFSDNYSVEQEAEWLKEMGPYLKSIDPYQHMITISYYEFFNKLAYQMPFIDFTQYHAYQGHIIKVMQSIVETFRQFRKPFFFAEFGSHSGDGYDDQDTAGNFLHGGLWSQAMQPTGGNAMPWWWSSHILRNNLYFHWKALSAFLRGIDRRGQDWQIVRQTSKIKSQLGPEETILLQGLRTEEQMIAWVAHKKSYNTGERSALPKESSEQVRFRLAWKQEGLYEVEYWDTFTGQIISIHELQSKDGHLELELPQFKTDIAFKLRFKPSSGKVANAR